MQSNKQINNLQINCSTDKFPHLSTALELLTAVRLGNSSCLKFKPVLLYEEQIRKSRGRKGNGSVSRASYQRFSWSPRPAAPQSLVLLDKLMTSSCPLLQPIPFGTTVPRGMNTANQG